MTAQTGHNSKPARVGGVAVDQLRSIVEKFDEGFGG